MKKVAIWGDLEKILLPKFWQLFVKTEWNWKCFPAEFLHVKLGFKGFLCEIHPSPCKWNAGLCEQRAFEFQLIFFNDSKILKRHVAYDSERTRKKLVGLLCMHLTRYIPWNNAFWPIAVVGMLVSALCQLQPATAVSPKALALAKRRYSTVGLEDYKNKTLLGDMQKSRIDIFEIYYPLLY